MRTDAIRLTQKQQARLRRRAIRLRQKGKSNSEVARSLSVHKKTVSGWWTAYGRIGHGLFEPGKRGRRAGAQRRLTPEQERDVRRLIGESVPDGLKLPFALWNVAAVGELIERRCGVDLPVRTLREYLRRWGYTPKRPQSRAAERTDQAMQTWLAQTYPSILKGARRESALLFWGDQTGVYGEPMVPDCVSTDDTAVPRQTDTMITMTMMRAVTNRGTVQFLVYTGALNAEFLVRFCGRLVASTEGRAVNLILDHRPMHHARAFRKWAIDHQHEFTVHYIPAIDG